MRHQPAVYSDQRHAMCQQGTVCCVEDSPSPIEKATRLLVHAPGRTHGPLRPWYAPCDRETAMRPFSPVPLLVAAIQLATVIAPSAASAQTAPNPAPARTGAGSTNGTILGTFFVSAGVVTILVGASVVALGALTENGGSDPSGPTSNTEAVPGGTAIAVGTLAVIGGIVLLVTSSNSASAPVPLWTGRF